MKRPRKRIVKWTLQPRRRNDRDEFEDQKNALFKMYDDVLKDKKKIID